MTHHPISITVFDGSKENPYEGSAGPGEPGDPDGGICPYDADIWGIETWCHCTPQQRQACAEDI